MDEAPALFRTKFLIYQIREAVEADRWEQGTAESPGVTRLAKELEVGSSPVGEQDRQGDNDYASVLQVFIQQAVAGCQRAAAVENSPALARAVRVPNAVYTSECYIQYHVC